MNHPKQPAGPPADPAGTSRITRKTSPDCAPLSYPQQRMWFFNQLEPQSSVYSGVRASRWSGPLDVGALERSIAELVRRHEVLRTRFPLTDRGVVQEIVPAGPLHLPLVDLSALAADSVEEEASSRLLAESRRPFDLTCDPPLRASLLRLAPDVHVLVLMIHHIAFDRWSRGLLRRELAVLYSAFAASRPSPLPEPAIQYRDYAAWQHERLRTEALERELTYWRERLGGAAPVLELSSDRPRPAAPTYRGRQVSFTLTDGLLEALGSLSRRERVSRFMTLLAAFNALLARSTGQTDLVVGTPIAGRTLVELSDLIGCFTNTLVLRTDLSGDPTFRELLGRVRQVALGAYAHQELPFEKLVEELQPERSTRHHPLFQVLFNYLDFPAAPLAVPGLRIEDIEMTLDTALVDLGVDIKRAGRTITCYVTGSADLFDAPTVSRLADQYRALLAAVAANPERRISSLPLAPAEGEPDETHRVLQELDEMSEEEAGRLLAELRDDIR